MAKERNLLYFVLVNFLFFLILFCSLRAYLLFSGNYEGNFPFFEVLAGFIEDSLLAAVLSWLTFLTLALRKALYFLFAFPLQVFIIIMSYSNLQYANFFRENLRLFDLEYIRNIGDLWKSTVTDLWIRPGEPLFLIVPLLILLVLAIFIIKLRWKKISFKKAMFFQSALILFSTLLFFTGAKLQNQQSKRAVHQSNYFVWMARDIPWLQRFFRTTKELKKMKISFQKLDSTSVKLDLTHLKSKKDASKYLLLKKRPFPLPNDYVWYDSTYPFIKIPKRDAQLIGLLPEKERNKDEDNTRKSLIRRNVVFIILEGFRSKEIDLFGGPYSITPYFNALASKSTLYTNFYGHRDLTAGAQLCSIASFYDTFQGVSIMRDHAHVELFSLPEILNLFGYKSYWINSWTADFDNSRVFFKLHGNFRIVDKQLFPANSEIAGWSYSDEEIMRMAVKTMDRAKKPFFAMILTATNHIPYEVPRKKFVLGLEKANFSKYLNTFHYTDYALGYFFKLVKTRKYFKDTIFFIYADTGNVRLKAGENSATNIYFSNVYHIPLLIYDPLAEGGKVKKEIAGQVDIAPTVLDLLGIKIANHFVGQSLMKKRTHPHYLCYHGRGSPKVFYINNSLLGQYDIERKELDFSLDRKNGMKVNVPLKDQENIIYYIQAMTTLTDWAILNDRIWDKQLTKFYKNLYVRKIN